MFELTKERVSKFLSYDSETGDFYWIADTNSRGPSKIGQKAGAPSGHGYIKINVLGHKTYAHRLAWLMVYGYMPEQLDHRNGNRSDNRLSNLREATQSQNIANRELDVLGFETHGTKYRARIFVNNVRHELGTFDTSIEASEAYWAAHEKFFGEFSIVNRPQCHI